MQENPIQPHDQGQISKPVAMTYEKFIDPATYGIDTEVVPDLTFQSLAAQPDIKHIRQLEDGNILIACAMPLLYLMDSQQETIGRTYMMVKQAELINALVKTLEKFDVFFQIKISTGVKRVDQTCVYVNSRNTHPSVLVNALRVFYQENRDNLFPIRLPLASTLTTADGEPMAGLNFRQSTTAKESPNALAAQAIRQSQQDGGSGEVQSATEYLHTKGGYSSTNPAFIEGSQEFAVIEKSSIQNGL